MLFVYRRPSRADSLLGPMVWWCVSGYTAASDTALTGSAFSSESLSHVIVQIGGRFCEYHRAEVEEALRQFKAVRQVEFLNHHGTVLVHYHSCGETPQQFADAVERALAAGWNCSARVERGQ